MDNDIGRSGVAVGLSSDDGAASVSALRASIPNAENFRALGVNCGNCRFGYHWAETRTRMEVTGTSGILWRHNIWSKVARQESGVQCFRFPQVADADEDYWCGEYQPAQGTPTRSAETTGSVGEADGGPVAKPCAQGDGQ